MTKAEQKLAAECFELAKALKWRREPFDAKEIEALGEHFYRVARSEAGNTPGRIELVLGAIEVLGANLCGPDFDGGEAWFSVALRTLMDVAEPSGIVESKEGISFLQRMEQGIKSLRGEENA